MTPELHDKIQKAVIGDSIYVKNSLGVFQKLYKITEVSNSQIKTSTLIFSKTSGTSVSDFKNLYIIDDVYFNIYIGTVRFFKSMKFKVLHSEYKSTYLQALGKSFSVYIRVYRKSNNFNNSIQIVIECNDITIFSGDIFNIQDLKVIYKCVLSKLFKE